jgi:streptogramin lyase
LSKDANGNAVTANVSTGQFPADAAGNSEIEDTVALPQPCIAPIVFVASPDGAWFAATGN